MVGRLFESHGRKEHPLGTGKFAAGPPSEFEELGDEPSPVRTEFATKTRGDLQQGFVVGGCQIRSGLLAGQPTVIVDRGHVARNIRHKPTTRHPAATVAGRGRGGQSLRS